MELRHLRYFVVVAEQLNITRAAELLHTSQPSLGRQIQQLEDLVQFKLFERKQHRLQLTEAGKAFLSDTRRLLRDLDASIARTRALASGAGELITIGYIAPAAVTVFSTLLPMLQQQFPEMKPQLRLHSASQQIAGLLDGSLDIGFLRGPIEQEQICSEVILKEQLYVFLPARHPMAGKRAIRLDDLKDLSFIEVSTQVLAQLQKLFPNVDFSAKRSAAAGDRETLIDQMTLIGSGLGYTVLTGGVREFAPATVAVKPIARTPAPEIDLMVAYREGNDSMALQHFLRVLRLWKTKPAVSGR